MSDKYFLLLKSGQAEMRAFQNLTEEQKAPIWPIVELTRGRKNHVKTFQRTGHEYNFDKVMDFLCSDLLPDQHHYIDLTKEPSLKSQHLISLGSSHRHYERWVSFIRNFKLRQRNAHPVMQITPNENDTWEDYRDAVLGQFDALAETCSCIAYRAIQKNDNTYDLDLQILADRVQSYCDGGNSFHIIVDYDYIRPGTGTIHAIEAAQVLTLINDIMPQATIILVATSFPKSVTDVSGENSGDISLDEVAFHHATATLLHNQFPVLYGDYGSINPIRNDIETAANGWRPRIDYPYDGDRLFYYREKRLTSGKGKERVALTTYSDHYRSVARSVTQNLNFIADRNSSDPTSWGVASIRAAANGMVPSSSPSFWISVRMNIHIQQQLRRLKLYPAPQSADIFG